MSTSPYSNFATVFNDQAYYQRAIASEPASTVKAFLLGGISWFCIPFAFATTLGLSAVALSHGENPLVHLTSAEVSAGLPAPKAAAGTYIFHQRQLGPWPDILELL
jgi:Na+/proline symporter